MRVSVRSTAAIVIRLFREVTYGHLPSSIVIYLQQYTQPKLDSNTKIAFKL